MSLLLLALATLCCQARTSNYHTSTGAEMFATKGGLSNQPGSESVAFLRLFMQVVQNVLIELGLFLNSLVFLSSEEPFCSRVAALPNAFCIHGRGIDDDDAGHEAAMGLGGRA